MSCKDNLKKKIDYHYDESNYWHQVFPSYRIQHAPKESLKAKSRRSGTSKLHQKFECILKEKGPRTTWNQKLTNITMKANIHTKFFALSSSACPKWGFESKKQELRHFKIASKVQTYSQRRRHTRTIWKQKLTNITMKALFTPGFFLLWKSSCPIRGFKSKKQALRHFKTTSKFRMYFRKRRPRTTWKQKLTNITMKTNNHANFYPLIELNMLHRTFWKQKAGAQAL